MAVAAIAVTHSKLVKAIANGELQLVLMKVFARLVRAIAKVVAIAVHKQEVALLHAIGVHLTHVLVKGFAVLAQDNALEL